MFPTGGLPSRTISAEVTIQAAPERVWQVLTDFAAYPNWNPLILEIAGPARLGGRIRARVQAPGRRALTLCPSVIAWEGNRELRLLACVGWPQILVADHRFVIEPLRPGVSRFTQSERFTGLVIPLLRRVIEVDTRRGLAAMNQALRTRAENAGE